MSPRALPLSDPFREHAASLTAKSFARDTDAEPLHAYNGVEAPGDSAKYAEAWRFPAVEPWDDRAQTEPGEWNAVTFTLPQAEEQAKTPSFVCGLPFSNLRTVPLHWLPECSLAAATVIIPAGRSYDYLFRRGDELFCDPVNPRRRHTLHGQEVSTFFTDFCFQPVTLRLREAELLRRITNHILPFSTREDELFIQNPGGGPQNLLSRQVQHLDHAVGVVNYIDKLLAREERHHLQDYRICLAEIDRILRLRNPYFEPVLMDVNAFRQLNAEMADNRVPEWNHAVYSDPSYFLFLLRRHTWTGAFSHPKYGGNVGAMGWHWLAGRFPFRWDLAVEKPLGISGEYLG